MGGHRANLEVELTRLERVRRSGRGRPGRRHRRSDVRMTRTGTGGRSPRPARSSSSAVPSEAHSGPSADNEVTSTGVLPRKIEPLYLGEDVELRPPLNQPWSPWISPTPTEFVSRVSRPGVPAVRRASLSTGTHPHPRLSTGMRRLHPISTGPWSASAPLPARLALSATDPPGSHEGDIMTAYAPRKFRQHPLRLLRNRSAV